jgi:sulfoxide reductase catalytic subunit YedY
MSVGATGLFHPQILRRSLFFEFSTAKNAYQHVGDFAVQPWQVRVDGLVESPQTFDLDDLLRSLPLEERIYRFRCVEAWSMVVPWTGFPLHRLLDIVRPTAAARYVRFTSFLDLEQAQNQRHIHWPWPYREGLTLEEAHNELTLLATGIYGEPLPKQNGAPVRLVVPWKYGYKSIKSITRIELVDEQPSTFWNTLEPDEYDFVSNVDPAVPHPRWSQKREQLIDTGERIDTLPYNGYGEYVAPLYA